ncbi:membrane glycoprotein E3 CR1-beta [Simian adenovirus DM-2014]|uniref:Membrane glycoprotein E3 CR1-beta n=1 Tax=Simian adenovirus DM-2014 TaxID=1560346 RepID=A0A097IWD4_9ADEN|nr:membrane glycoprotein E3 CR1-beta [Simian adenovirus DM-2014]AIT70991.1 membrane glycoprotein E3 CR1-beta [Simian adenovirus DM-2014]
MLVLILLLFSTTLAGPIPNCYVSSFFNPNCFVAINCLDNSTIIFNNKSSVNYLAENFTSTLPDFYLINSTLSNGITKMFNFSFPISLLCSVIETNETTDYTVLHLLLLVIAFLGVLAVSIYMCYCLYKYFKSGSYTLPREQNNLHLAI